MNPQPGTFHGYVPGILDALQALGAGALILHEGKSVTTRQLLLQIVHHMTAVLHQRRTH
jgi:hypothetical protein